MHLEYVFGEINADGANLHVDDLPPVIRYSTITLWHIRRRERASSTTSFATELSSFSCYPMSRCSPDSGKHETDITGGPI